MGKSYSSAVKVPYFLCDRKGELTLPNLINLLIGVSSKQSRVLGVGEDYASEKGLSWIVLQYEFFLERMPQNGETVKIETIAKEYNNIFTYREFFVYGEDERKIISIHSTFALIDTKKRKLTKIPSYMIEAYEADFNQRIKRNPKPQVIELDEMDFATYRVQYFDIDGNQHVNNSVYTRWMIDTLDSTFLDNHRLIYGNVKYEKEVFEGEIVDSYFALFTPEEENESYQSLHQIKVGDKLNCLGEFKWQER